MVDISPVVDLGVQYNGLTINLELFISKPHAQRYFVYVSRCGRSSRKCGGNNFGIPESISRACYASGKRDASIQEEKNKKRDDDDDDDVSGGDSGGGGGGGSGSSRGDFDSPLLQLLSSPVLVIVVSLGDNPWMT
uniref:Uncharacterized protein n=1 Tax=Vespula pensylvanica TaxID=30213 RepID=A0A834JPR0_VESPE|nr:hypothetical protein H0235_017360 [Vespula pensylvanica]